MKINAKILFLILGFILGIFTSSFVYLYLNINQQKSKTFENSASTPLLNGVKTLSNYSDLEYLNLMIINRNDAIEMSDIALKNSQNKTISNLAKEITLNMAEEINKMKIEMENIINSQ